MLLFYILDLQNPVLLSEEESKHCIKVLRLQKGDSLHLTDGKGHLAKAEIIEANPKKCVLQILDIEQFPQKKDFKIHLAVAPTKNADRMEWLVEKCIEIGIDEISFFQAQHSERQHFNLERLQKKAIAALKQSLHLHLPKMNALLSFKNLIANSREDQKFIAYVDSQNPSKLFESAKKNQSYLVLIGPEGDFSTQELDLALKNNFQKISLGNSRLRTETAGIVACLTLNLLNE